MIRLEMKNTKAKSIVETRLRVRRSEGSVRPSDVERRFACQLATSVWLKQLRDNEAGMALSAYVSARYRSCRERADLRAALESEYTLCRERLDLCN
jgi:hypothetical protein